MTPGRSCPLHYRYQPSDLSRAPDLTADTLYVVGGLYGNLPALEAVLEMIAREAGPVTLVFNGDFNWFNVDAAGFKAVNREVLNHVALRGNVETEIAGDDAAAGCGCAYPEWVGDAEVERSNRIIERLRGAALQQPDIRGQLAALPMHLVAEVGGVRIAIVHGDGESLAGWNFSQEALADIAHRRKIARQFEIMRARIIASSHTCLPVALDFDTAQGRCALINNGAAGMPNFISTHYGVITRIATRRANHVVPLYGTRLDAVRIEALPVRYDQARWQREFLANWPQGSAAHASYYQRIATGPAYDMAQAARLSVSLAA
ncbi:MAG: hypothetical protein Q8K18_12720 [Burkholderiales bacterium]|nr:hypothetical protein [Burkholderiales bacterium]